MKRLNIYVQFCLVVFIIISCGGEGTLTVTTTPVPGTISVDGKPVGESPVTLTLKNRKA
ncbi:PEGA domain-containing protein [Candidatus Latescibacterota bacterium]